MEKCNITRKNIIDTLINNLKPLNYIHAFWEAGAASFNRVDHWSDIDLYVVCDDNRVEDTFKSMEQAILNISELDLTFRLPEPTWHGHSQVFWRLKGANPFLFVDIAVMKKSSKDKFLQYRVHGEPLIHFDKIGIVKDDPIDTESFFQKIKTRIEMLKTTFDLFQVLVLKELNRGNDIEAFSYYISYTYRPLVELLRMKYCPYHYNFFTTYMYYDLPKEIVQCLQRLYFISNGEALRKARDEAEEWFWDEMKTIHLEDVKKKLNI